MEMERTRSQNMNLSAFPVVGENQGDRKCSWLCGPGEIGGRVGALPERRWLQRASFGRTYSSFSTEVQGQGSGMQRI